MALLEAWATLFLMESDAPLVSAPGLLIADVGAERVGVVMSMGSLSGGPDIWMVGVRMGTVRGAIGSSLVWTSLRGVLCGLRSITCAICTRTRGMAVSMVTTTGEQSRSKDRELIGDLGMDHRRHERVAESGRLWVAEGGEEGGSWGCRLEGGPGITHRIATRNRRGCEKLS